MAHFIPTSSGWWNELFKNLILNSPGVFIYLIFQYLILKMQSKPQHRTPENFFLKSDLNAKVPLIKTSLFDTDYVRGGFPLGTHCTPVSRAAGL